MRYRLMTFLSVSVAIVLSPNASAQSPSVRQVPIVRMNPFPPSVPINANAGVGPELDSAVIGNDPDSSALNDTAGPGIALNRSITGGPGGPMPHPGSARAESHPELQLSFDALNHFEQRFVAAGGNQFSLEPPDQGLCVGNGFVLETVNDVLRVFDTAGNPLSAPIALNGFYGYAPAIDRTKNPPQYGPEITDPSCLFDRGTQRWFHVVLTLDRVDLKPALAGTNHLDIAVSTTSSPLGTWNLYSLPVQNDGTQGTPDHHCTLGTNPAHGPCLGDYPHIGADSNGFYITTNEFNFVSPGFRGAQIYAFSKRQLAAGASSITVVQFDTGDPSLGLQLDGHPGFTVWPAVSTGESEDDDNGKEYFLSSVAVFQSTRADNRLRLWTMRNTGSLDGMPSVSLSTRVVSTIPYSVPPRSNQKPGDVPLAECLSDSMLPVTPTLSGCWRLVPGLTAGPFPNTEKVVDSNDSRMQQVVLANGKLWAALDTGLSISGDPTTRAGVAYFIINPNSAKVHEQGYAGVAGNNLTYPAIVATENGRGVIAFTVLGDDHYPSAGYATVDAKKGAGAIHVIAEGAGPDDGFTGYNPASQFGNRPRWGDYGAAAVDGDSIWIASEYINQTCTYDTWLATNFGCGNTRTQLANWGTRITQLGF